MPTHGALTIGGVEARAGDTFSQSDVDRGFVSYHHDHSDAARDAFGISLFLEGDPRTGGEVLLFTGLCNVTVLPVNDQVLAFYLIFCLF